jgi:preprotein translocase subunit SecE
MACCPSPTCVRDWKQHLDMKKPSQKTKSKKDPKKKSDVSKRNGSEAANGQPKSPAENRSVAEKAPRMIKKSAKKAPDPGEGTIGRIVGKTGKFLREAKVELKKVKWPTRKELLASTAVVIVLTLVVAFFLGLVDFGLIKIIRNVVG